MARMGAARDDDIAEHMRHATSTDPNRSYAAEWRFFVESKGRSLTDRDLIRSYDFTLEFTRKWQDARIILDVRHWLCRWETTDIL